MTIELKDLFSLDQEINEKMVYTILTALKNGSEDGFDYLKFKNSIKALKDMHMDEDTSIKSSFATAKSMGVNKEGLLLSLQRYENIINKERDQFIVALKNQIHQGVEIPKTEIASIHDKIEENKRKIEQLQKENAIIQEKISIIEANIKSSEEKIENTRLEFIKVYEGFITQLQNDKQKFENLL